MSLREFDVYEFAEMDKEYLWTHENENRLFAIGDRRYYRFLVGNLSVNSNG